jgi:hypothetical protein
VSRPDECAAYDSGHRFGPHGPGGETQCEFCGASPSPAPAVEPGTAALRAWRSYPYLHEATEADRDARRAAEAAVEAALLRDAEHAGDFSDDALREAHVEVYPARNVPGVWVSRFTTYDLSSLGSSRTGAVVSLIDAARMMLEHERDRPPSSDRSRDD